MKHSVDRWAERISGNTMGNIFQKIEEAMVAAAFAEEGEQEFAASLLSSGKTSHKKVLLSTDCPVVTGKVLDHALQLCKRLGSMLEVYQIIPSETVASSPREFFEAGTRRLQSIQDKLSRIGISYKYAIKEATLEEELKLVAQNRRDIMAVIIPMCDSRTGDREQFRTTMSKMFNCPVVFFES
ncbi:MAG: hypothetical protein ACYCYR_16670 [Desulfobulbaceae bacterium]